MNSEDSFQGTFNIKPKQSFSPSQFIDGILKGDTTLLGRAITLVESLHPDHRSAAREIVEGCMPHAGNSVRVGVTGVPGVGKSTFIEAFGNYLIDQHQRRVAVLAVDPSSAQSRGSILGDKTRMHTLSRKKEAFIRPSPSSGALGGVARATRETIILCEAAGFDTILVETVGVGQSETAVHSMVDFFLLLMLAGAGDELQGIKRGIMELADLVVIHKADGDNLTPAKRARREYQNALHLFPAKPSGWQAMVEVCSSLNGSGIDQVWKHIDSFRKQTTENGYFKEHRKQQTLDWMYQSIEALLKEDFFKTPSVKVKLAEFETAVLEGKISAFHAAEQLIGIFKIK